MKHKESRQAWLQRLTQINDERQKKNKLRELFLAKLGKAVHGPALKKNGHT